VNHFLFKDRDGQTILPKELYRGLKIKTIQTMGELDEYEEDNIAKGLLWLIKQKEDPKKYPFWIKLHKKLFDKVWSWAGKIRIHELDNPDFCNPLHIWSKLYQLEKDLSYWLDNKSYPINYIMALFHERIETIHPFANGNGRFGRILTEQICRSLEVSEPTWGKRFSYDFTQRRKHYIDAIIIARRDFDHKPLTEIMFS
jgi:Fic-DOC domain mobile mystery protein B